MSREQTIPVQHPALEGHFPGNPVVPGVVILQQVVEAAENEGYNITGIASAKFLAPLLPEQPFSINFMPGRVGLSFEVNVAGNAIAQGSLSLEGST